MIEISLQENGHCYGCTQYFHGCDDAVPMYITECFRCIGFVIVWKRKADADPGLFAPQYAASAFHIPPYKGSVSHGRRILIASLKTVQECYEPTTLVYMGGKINTPINRYYYEKGKKDFILPFKHLFPSLEIKGFEPTEDQHCSTLYMDEEMNFLFESFKAA